MASIESSDFVPVGTTKTFEITVYKCGKCGTDLYGPLLWRVTVESRDTGATSFDGLACEKCQREMLDTHAVFVKDGIIW